MLHTGYRCVKDWPLSSWGGLVTLVRPLTSVCPMNRIIFYDAKNEKRWGKLLQPNPSFLQMTRSHDPHLICNIKRLYHFKNAYLLWRLVISTLDSEIALGVMTLVWRGYFYSGWPVQLFQASGVRALTPSSMDWVVHKVPERVFSCLLIFYFPVTKSVTYTN